MAGRRRIPSLEEDVESFKQNPSTFRSSGVKTVRFHSSVPDAKPPPAPVVPPQAPPVVLSGIKERPFTTDSPMTSVGETTGFPVAHRNTISSSKRVKNKSLFLQNLEAKGKARSTRKAKSPSAQVETVGVLNVPEHARLGLKESDIVQVHAGNTRRIENMSEKEILEAQEEILGALDSTLISKLKASLGTKVSAAPQHPPPKTEVVAPRSIHEIKTRDELFEASRDQLPASERDKLLWTGEMRSADYASKEIKEEEWKASWQKVRFDLKGNIVTAGDEYKPELHHHFEQQEKAGYTVKEIFGLCRSNVLGQRLLGYKLLGAILQSRQTALYKTKTKHPIFVLPQQVYTIVRCGLDDTNFKVVEGALEALRWLIVPHYQLLEQRLLETTCTNNRACAVFCGSLVRAQGDGNVYNVAMEEICERKSDETDEELCVRSPIHGLLEMNLLQRLSFIQQNLSTYEPLYDVLTAIVLHGKNSLDLLLKETTLVEMIVQNKDQVASIRLMRRMIQCGAHVSSLRLSHKNFDLLEHSIKMLNSSEDVKREALLLLRVLSLLGHVPAPSQLANYSLTETFEVLGLWHKFPETSINAALDCNEMNCKHLTYLAKLLHHKWRQNHSLQSARVETERILSYVEDANVVSHQEQPNSSQDTLHMAVARKLVGIARELTLTLKPTLNRDSLECLDRISAWTTAVTICARSGSTKALLVQLVPKLNEFLHACMEFSHDNVGATISPIALYTSSAISALGVCVLEALIQLRHVSREDRLKALYLLFPHSVDREQWLASVVSGSLVSLTDTLELKELLISEIGTAEAIERSYRLHSLGGTDPIRSLRLERKDKSWSHKHGSWPLLGLLLAPSHLFAVQGSLAVMAHKCLREALPAADIIVCLLRFASITTEQVLFDESVTASVESLVVASASILMKDPRQVQQQMRTAAGGKAALVDVYRSVIVAFNEGMYGHVLLSTLLYLPVSLNFDHNLAWVIWEELYGANMLRLLQPSKLLETVSGQRPSREVRQLMADSLLERRLIKDTNEPLYRLAVHELGQYIFKDVADVSVERKRLLRDLTVACKCIYNDLCTSEDGRVAESRLDVVRCIAQEDMEVAKILAKDGIEF